MKKTVVTLIMALLITAAAGVAFVNLGRANPFTNSQYSGEKGAPPGAPSPIVSILSPENNREYNTDSITLNFNASVEEFSEGGYNSPLIRGMRIDESSYTADWLDNFTQIDLATYLDPEEASDRVSVSLNLSGIPDGKHVIRVHVFAQGSIVDPFHWYTFETGGSSKVSFTIDTVPPRVTVFPIGNMTFTESKPVEVHLNFTLNEPAAKISYVLDERGNVTVEGNTTLSGLSTGEHNVTIFAWDAAGNVGCSETVAFTVVEPFPTLSVVAVSIASISAVGTGLLLFYRKHRREAART